MEYPKINLSLEALRAREGEYLENLDLPEFKFQIDAYRPGTGGSGHFHGEMREWNFQSMDELCEIVVNQMDLPAEAFFYQDAMSTCEEIEQDLRRQGVNGHWKDQMIISSFTGTYPARARVCYYQPAGEEQMRSVAVLRDGTTIKHFRPWQSDR